MKIIKVALLFLLSSMFDDNQSNDLKFFFIEPVDREYLIHNVIFENPTI